MMRIGKRAPRILGPSLWNQAIGFRVQRSVSRSLAWMLGGCCSALRSGRFGERSGFEKVGEQKLWTAQSWPVNAHAAHGDCEPMTGSVNVQYRTATVRPRSS